MKSAVLILAAGICVAGCSSDQGSGTSLMSSSQNPNSNTVPPSDNSQNSAAINAGNQQFPSAQGHAIQGQSDSDLRITADIHRRIAEQNLSGTNAPNVNVFTANGMVTLTGTVTSAADRVAVGRAAREIAGDNNVDNEVQVSRTY